MNKNHPQDPDKLSFFDIPRFIQIARDTYAEEDVLAASNLCFVALHVLKKTNVREVLNKTIPGTWVLNGVLEGPHLDMQREHYALVCNEPWVDDLQQRVEAIFNQTT